MKKYYSLKIIVSLISIILIACTKFESNEKTIKDPIEVSLHPYVGRLVTVNALVGDDSLKLLFDTGGGKTFIGSDVARRLGCEPSGRSIGFRMNGEMVESKYCHNIAITIGGVSFQHDNIGVWDINSVLPEDFPPLDGILSLKTFLNQPFTLDLSSNHLIFESEKSLNERIKRMTKLESRIATGPDGSELTVFLHGRIKDYGWFLIDSGNLDVFLVSHHFAENIQNDSTTSTSTWESEFTFKNFLSSLTRFRTKEIIYDGVISEEFLRKWIFTFELYTNSVWIEPVASK